MVLGRAVDSSNLIDFFHKASVAMLLPLLPGSVETSYFSDVSESHYEAGDTVPGINL